MIICLSPSDLLEFARAFGRFYNDKVYQYTAEGFNAGFKADQLIEETRITFLGHASIQQSDEPGLSSDQFAKFGTKQLTPDQFAKQFEALRFPKNIPLIIDLVGCQIGFSGADKDKPNYMHQVYDELMKLGYKDIVINSFTNVAVKETIVEQIVNLGPIIMNNKEIGIHSCSLVGFTESDQQKYNSDKEVIQLKKELAEIDNKIAELKKNNIAELNKSYKANESYERITNNIADILEGRPPSRDYSGSTVIINMYNNDYTEAELYDQYIKKRNDSNFNISNIPPELSFMQFSVGYSLFKNIDTEAFDQINLLKAKRNEISRQLEDKDLKSKYQSTFMTTKDFRKLFDSNENYQVNRHNHDDYKLPPHAKMAIRMLNDRIAELTLEVNEIKDSAILSFFSGLGTKRGKLQSMKNIISSIRNNPELSNVTSLINSAAAAEDAKTLLIPTRTEDTLKEIQKELKKYEHVQQPQKQAPGGLPR